MFIKHIGKGFYWYNTTRTGDKVVSSYLSKATKQEVARWKKDRKIKR